MGNIYDALIDLGYEDVEEDFETEMDLGRDVPDNPFLNDVDIEEYEDWVSGHIGEPEYLGDR